jgi:hypothetical protein
LPMFLLRLALSRNYGRSFETEGNGAVSEHSPFPSVFGPVAQRDLSRTVKQ